jgi:hypothetical protein
MDVPPCFVAIDETRVELGVLMESFLGYPDEAEQWRLVHGSDILERFITDKKRGRPHGVRTNVQLCKRWRIEDAPEWWGKVLVFDAIIGNTDRHPENWGILHRAGDHWKANTVMAPAFDNATSLGYEIGEERLSDLSNRSSLDKYVERGCHDCGWDTREDGPTPHTILCARFVDAYPSAVPAMRNVIGLSQSAVAEILHECTCFDVTVPFSARRAKFVAELIERRREQISAVLGERRW